MKIPKALLGAILAGITVQAISSCDKGKQDRIKPASEQPAVSYPGQQPDPVTDPCPACGMG